MNIDRLLLRLARMGLRALSRRGGGQGTPSGPNTPRPNPGTKRAAKVAARVLRKSGRL